MLVSELEKNIARARKMRQPTNKAGDHRQRARSPGRRQTLNKTAGIVLAAGASSRMGAPKALLDAPDGLPLAVFQAQLLQTAGCRKPLVVLGSEAERIAPALLNAGVDFAVNTNWTLGRFGSVQTGLHARPGFDGYLILPVDTVGIQRETLAALLLEAYQQNKSAFRPRFNGTPGRVLWLRNELAGKLLAMAKSDTPLDQHLAPLTGYFDVDDPAILNNTNTPEEWAAVRDLL